MLDSLLQDSRHAIRSIRRSPKFASIAIVMLALGIGVNTTVFTIAYSVLFRGFPLVEDSERLLFLTTYPTFGASYPDFVDWRNQATSFADMALVQGTYQTLTDGTDYAETYYTTKITANTFGLVGQQPLLGRDFVADDELPGADAVAILTYKFWDQRYAKDPNVLGRKVRLDGAVTTIIGVMPSGFFFPQNQVIWVPKVRTAEVARRGNRENWFVVGRLSAGATLESARAELVTIGHRLEAAYPETNTSVPHVTTFREMFIGKRATMIYAAMIGAASFVMLITCANLANLLLARALSRSREMAVRVALGAGRGRIARQLLCESLLLAVAGTLLGAGLAALAVSLFARFATGASLSDAIGGDWFNGITSFAIDGHVLTYVAALAIATGLLFGLIPAVRIAQLDVNSGLKDASRAGTRTRAKALSSALLVSQMALAIMLLSGAGVMARSFLNIYFANTGARLAGLNAALLQLPASRYPDGERRSSFLTELSARLGSAPEIESATLSSELPTRDVEMARYTIEGTELVDPNRAPSVGVLTVGASYFETLGTGVVAGRPFEAFDTPSAVPAVIVNSRFAATEWPGESALGKRLRMLGPNGPSEWLTVVGIAPEIAQGDSTRQTKKPLLYRPYDQVRSAVMFVLARSRTTADVVAGVIQREVRTLDPDLPTLFLSRTALRDYLASAYQYRGASGALFLGCAAMALLLASFGLYAVIAYAVTQQRREIGVRIAIGAANRHILALVLQSGFLPLGVGIVLGLVAAFVGNRLLASLLVGVSPADPITLAVACGTLIVAAALGCWLPARRATRIDPVVALRQE
jgi:predicted permease